MSEATAPTAVVKESLTTDWQPLATAPWGEVVWVRNELMDHPVKATRGYVYNGAVHPDRKFFTTVYTPDPLGLFPTPSGQLVCPTEWAPLAEQVAS